MDQKYSVEMTIVAGKRYGHSYVTPNSDSVVVKMKKKYRSTDRYTAGNVFTQSIV